MECGGGGGGGGGRWEGAKTLTDFDLWPFFSSARYEMQWQHSGVEHVACVSFFVVFFGVCVRRQHSGVEHVACVSFFVRRQHIGIELVGGANTLYSGTERCELVGCVCRGFVSPFPVPGFE